MRITSIDFSRGVAVLLVVFRHFLFEPIFITIGWTGVDLFFVLSGFLVSNLLFQEYKTTGTVKPIRF
jgi:peptidoglycan/LPS O-acetylase OafA/YrhL